MKISKFRKLVYEKYHVYGITQHVINTFCATTKHSQLKGDRATVQEIVYSILERLPVQ